MKRQILFCVVNVLIYLLIIAFVSPLLSDLGSYGGVKEHQYRELVFLGCCTGLSLIALVVSCVLARKWYHRIWPGLASFAISILMVWGYELAYTLYNLHSVEIRTALHRKKDWCHWDILLSAVPNHPIAVGDSKFYYLKGKERESRRFSKNGGAYGSDRGGRIGLEDFQDVWDDYAVYPLPAELEINWFSFSELKVYSAKADLPREVMRELFLDTGYCVDGVMKKCDALKVGLAPGGLVTVWAVCGVYNLELMQLRVQESFLPVRKLMSAYSIGEIQTNTDCAAYYLGAAAYEEVLRNLETRAIKDEIKLYERYMKRYATRIVIDFEDPSSNSLQKADVRCVNGEYLQLCNTNRPLPECADLAGIESVDLEWLNRDCNGVESVRSLKIGIGGDELLRIWDGKPDRVVDIRVCIPEGEGAVELFAAGGSERIVFDGELIIH